MVDSDSKVYASLGQDKPVIFWNRPESKEVWKKWWEHVIGAQKAALGTKIIKDSNEL